jgi:hypothetical protein
VFSWITSRFTVDKSGANTAAIDSVKADACVDILMRQNKYLNNIVEQDHRAIKRITRSMLGFKSLWSARIIIAGIETHAHDSQGAVGLPRGPNHACGTAVLQPSGLINRPSPQLFSHRLHYSNKTLSSSLISLFDFSATQELPSIVPSPCYARNGPS